MATQNPRVATYLSPSLHRKLTAYMERHSLKSESKAVGMILTTVLGDDLKEPVLDRLTVLERRVEKLEASARLARQVVHQSIPIAR